MGKIGDLWVRLGLKKEEYDAGMAQAERRAGGFGDKMKTVGASAKAVWAAIGVAVVAFADKFAHHSQAIGDRWDQTMSRMKAAWNQMLTALTQWDWNNFGNRIKNAMDAAAKSTAAHDAEFEIQNSIDLRKAQMQEELAILQVEMRNTKNSYEQRAKYAEEYLNKLRPLYEEEAKMRRNTMVADKNEYLAKVGVPQSAANRQNLESFFTNVAPNSQLLNALSEYSKKNSNKKYKLTAEDNRILDEFQASLGNDYAAFGAIAEMARGYQSTNDETAKKVVDAIQTYYASAAAFDEETRRVQQVMNSAEAQSSIDTSSIDTSKMMHDADRDRAEKILQRAQDAAKSEVQLLQEKYAEEKALLQQFGIDTEALTKEYYGNIFDILEDETDKALEHLGEYEPIVIEPFEFEDDTAQEFLDEMEAMTRRAEELAEEFKAAVVYGISDGIQEMMDQLMGLSDINAGAIFAALLTPLADMAVREGEILVAEGIGVEAVKKALESLNGVAAIAAGSALIAIGSAARAGLKSLASGGGGASATSTAVASDTRGGYGYETNTEITVHVEGRLKGSDILLSGSKTQNAWGR